MRANTPSRTALRSARRRAAHQLFDRPLVLQDPFAVPLVAAIEAGALEGDAKRTFSALEKTIRAFMVARSRYAEDCLQEALERGITQYVVLGAGLDTFAYRSQRQDLRVFEVDHPATQAWKITALQAAGIQAGTAATFVPVDFNNQKFDIELAHAGWRRDIPTFFSWLGVTSYLSRERVLETLRSILAYPKGTEIVFDVSTPMSQQSLKNMLFRLPIKLKAALSGEPNGTRFDPVELAHELRGIGFDSVTAVDHGALNGLYFANRDDGLNVSNRSALLRARVG